MATSAVVFKSIEYRVVLIEPDSRALLALNTSGGCHLPRIRVPRGTRPVEQLRKVIHARWGLHALILDFMVPDDGSVPCVIAELLTPPISRSLERIVPRQLASSELTEAEHSAVLSLLDGNGKSPFTRIGWLDEAAAWIESATGRKLSRKSDLEQINAGGAFALIRFYADNSWSCWMKATGEPNAHELLVTSLLSQLCKGYVPEFIGSKPQWNAWLMAGEARGIACLPANPFELFCLLEDAVGSLAELQVRTLGAESDLLDAGAFDQRLDVLLGRSDELFDYLDEVMDLAASRNLPRLAKKRLQEIRIAFEMVCEGLQHLSVPQTIVHGDMNPGNIVIGRDHSQFIDWSEAYVGHCLVSLEHLLLLLNGVENPIAQTCMATSLKQRYVSVWARVCDPIAFEEAIRYMPLMATASTLYGRGEWLNSPERYNRRRLSHARTLATCMDCALRRPALQEALCALRPTRLCVPAVATCS